MGNCKRYIAFLKVQPACRRKSSFEFGAYASINYSANLGKIVTYKGKLDLFSNYRNNPQNVDLYLTNLFAAKFQKCFQQPIVSPLFMMTM